MDYSSNFENCTSVRECLESKELLLNSEEIITIKSQIKTADNEQKKILGSELNEIKQSIAEACNTRIKQLQLIAEQDVFEPFDPSFHSPLYKTKQASLHPISLITNEIVSIFRKKGFDVWDGPHIQSQDNNFNYVNTPAHHPARDMQDTFFIKEKDEKGENYVMRTQVTANIIPYARTHKPPFKVIFPGIVYRNEDIDLTHDIHFTQFDMWLVDKSTSLSNLTTLIASFFQELYNDDSITIRLRPSYFPFTQPSFEGDMSCPFCHGQGCRVCKHTGWIEVFGAGPIHKNVIRSMDLDPEEWGGIAFGFGVDRLAQLKFKITGISQFYNAHLDFLRGEE